MKKINFIMFVLFSVLGFNACHFTNNVDVFSKEDYIAEIENYYDEFDNFKTFDNYIYFNEVKEFNSLYESKKEIFNKYKNVDFESISLEEIEVIASDIKETFSYLDEKMNKAEETILEFENKILNMKGKSREELEDEVSIYDGVVKVGSNKYIDMIIKKSYGAYIEENEYHSFYVEEEDKITVFGYAPYHKYDGRTEEYEFNLVCVKTEKNKNEDFYTTECFFKNEILYKDWKWIVDELNNRIGWKYDDVFVVSGTLTYNYVKSRNHFANDYVFVPRELLEE